MSKPTNHKRLWRNEKKKNVILANEVVRLNDVIKGQASLIIGIRDGKIDVADVLTNAEEQEKVFKKKLNKDTVEYNKTVAKEGRVKEEKVKINPVLKKDRSQQKVI